MSDACEKTLTFRTYARTSEARSIRISKAPANAPDARKPLAQVKAEIERSVDEDMAARNALPEEECYPCGLLSTKESVEDFISEGNRQWREDYSLQDASGNTFTGTALYTARGDISGKVTIRTRICGPASFGDKLAMLEDIDLEIPAVTLAALDYGAFVSAVNDSPEALAKLGLTPQEPLKKG